MKPDLDQNDREFLDHLQRHPVATVTELCDSLGITATAVRQRLERLRHLGLVDRQRNRSGRGRPHYEYQVSDLGRRSLGENYTDLAQILWREIERIEDDELRARLLQRIEDALVDHYGRTVNPTGTLGERLEQLRTALVNRGFDVEQDGTSELPVLRENNCPYLELAEQDRRICELEQAVFERVLGASLERTSRCLDGHTCCEFQATERIS